ncbi:nuclear localized protein 1 [Citrus sinensis]|uniref:Nuclear localized protein 1 n=1 Tax=Citrus sinensis TaxID=2711 RepID=A0ACB8NTZ4_CITSI|nr:nuclear localized protein 1 [Citrus sinensis]
MEREAEPWEALALALDLEFEDSRLVPCKRKNQISPAKTNKFFKANSNPFLSPCSKTQKHLVPGPARAVQSAMQHKTLMGMSVGVNEEPIPTQEFIRRAVEDAGLEDEDFSQNPWLFAVDFVRSQGLVGVDGVAIGTPLSQIKNGMINGDRVSQIVAIVKSTTPNGLGDMMATLKDPTGTIDASIHRRVLTEGELGKDLSVGAVLILHKVAVFSPSRSACCLNITVSNIVKISESAGRMKVAVPWNGIVELWLFFLVISKDTEAPIKANCCARIMKHSSTDLESGENCLMPNKTSSLSQGQVEKVNLSPPSSFHGAEGNGSQNFVVEKEMSVMRQDIFDGIKVAARRGTNCNDKESLLDDQPKPSNQFIRKEGIMNYLRPNANVRGSVQNTEQTAINSEPHGSFSGDGGSRIWNSFVEKELFAVMQDVDRSKVAVGAGTSGNDMRILMGDQLKTSNQVVRGNLLKEIQCNSAPANFVRFPGNNEENGNAAGIKNHSQLIFSKGSLSQWTDEQLDKLLSFD